MRDRTKLREAGFTLMELVVAIVIMTLLAGIAIPAFRSLQDDAKVAKLLAVVDTVRMACQKHYADTSRFAVEYSENEAVGSHQLFQKQAYAGWKGPYLDQPLRPSDNPFSGRIYVARRFTMNGPWQLENNAFYLSGASGPATTGRGNYICFTNVPEARARQVDEALDRGVKGDWKKYGRVQWTNHAGGTVKIYLLSEK